MMTKDLIQRQLELEQEGIRLGVQRYKKALEKTPESEMPPGLALMHRSIEPMVQAIQAFKKPSRGAARLQATKRFLMLIDDYDIAYVTAKVLLNSISEAKNLQTIADALGTELHTHLEYTKFRAEEPNYLAAIEKRLDRITRNPKQRRTSLMHIKRDKGIEDEPFSKEESIGVGIKCIEMFIETTGLVERVKIDKNQHTLQGTAEAMLWIAKHHAKCELLSPVYLPMIVPPAPWDDVYGGGFLTNEATMKIKLVKTSSQQALELLEGREMPAVYKAVNTLQETAWEVNKDILKVAQDAWQIDRGVAGLVRDEEEPLPPKIWTDDDEFERMKEEQPEAIKAWKIKASEVYSRRIKNKSKRFQVAQKLWVAEKFLEEEAIYFVWTLDWRGRLYPVQSFVNPQADDLGKSLLRFKEGKALGERGAYWLAVHLANKYGEDKLSFDDRVQWTLEHEEDIIDSAKHPLGGWAFWEDADDPWGFLAACIEWLGYKTEGESFVSHLPIAMDGTCNGLQNFSAMLLDEVGGSAVNLVPQDKPADVYQAVVDVVNEKIAEDAEAGEELAKLWIGKVDRSLAKRNVMTVPYGVKLYGMKDQLIEEIRKRDDELALKGETYLDTENPWLAIGYLAGIMQESINEVVVAAKLAMDWLQDVASLISQSGKAFNWVTPAGFLVHQHYRKQRSKQIHTYWGLARLRVRVGINEDTEKLDTRKQRSGISPNFVHSMDASHLMLTINKCKDEGITSLACIHDSYGTHAASTDRLMYLLRDAFIEQYNQDVLKLFAEDVLKQIDEKAKEKMPEIPEKGNLDLESVRDSLYFFA